MQVPFSKLFVSEECNAVYTALQQAAVDLYGTDKGDLAQTTIEYLETSSAANVTNDVVRTLHAHGYSIVKRT